MIRTVAAPWRTVIVTAALLALGALVAETRAEAPRERMTVERLNTLILAVDENATKLREHQWVLTVSDLALVVIADPANDRMRILSHVVSADQASPELLIRIMQANFDTALDARYAIAQGVIWSAYIHPLGSLEDDQFLSGVGQTANLVRTFGETFYSGAMTFRGGDSQGLIERQLIEELLLKGERI
ncbi:MAG: hypothetical protein QNJ84_03855 [Alphaproteobacteria bacterium]|nr:hypothetical protein [Alphaproteobacteria bacterium]